MYLFFICKNNRLNFPVIPEYLSISRKFPHLFIFLPPFSLNLSYMCISHSYIVEIDFEVPGFVFLSRMLILNRDFQF